MLRLGVHFGNTKWIAEGKFACTCAVVKLQDKLVIRRMESRESAMANYQMLDVWLHNCIKHESTRLRIQLPRFLQTDLQTICLVGLKGCGMSSILELLRFLRFLVSHGEHEHSCSAASSRSDHETRGWTRMLAESM